MQEHTLSRRTQILCIYVYVLSIYAYVHFMKLKCALDNKFRSLCMLPSLKHAQTKIAMYALRVFYCFQDVAAITIDIIARYVEIRPHG